MATKTRTLGHATSIVTCTATKVGKHPIIDNVNSGVLKYRPSDIVIKVYIIIEMKTAILSLVPTTIRI